MTDYNLRVKLEQIVSNKALSPKAKLDKLVELDINLSECLFTDTMTHYMSGYQTATSNPVSIVLKNGEIIDLKLLIKAYNKLYKSQAINTMYQFKNYLTKNRGYSAIECITNPYIFYTILHMSNDLYTFVHDKDYKYASSLSNMLGQPEIYMRELLMCYIRYPSQFVTALESLNHELDELSIPSLLVSCHKMHEGIDTILNELDISQEELIITCSCTGDYLFRTKITGRYHTCDRCETTIDKLDDVLTYMLENGASIKGNLIENSADRITESPAYIYQYLDRFITAQEDVKREIATAASVYINSIAVDTDIGLDFMPPVTLIGGPTGTGKSYIVKTLGNLIDIPVVTVDANSLSPSGYKGDNVDEILDRAKKTIKASYTDRVIKQFAYVLFIDEFDKLIAADDNVKTFRDSVQANVLKILEEGIPDDNPILDKYRKPFIVLAGSFMGPRNQNFKDENKPTTAGFSRDLYAGHKEEIPPITHTDLEKFGLLPELVGRINSIVETKELTEDDYYDILQNKENSAVDKIETICKMMGVPIGARGRIKLIDSAVFAAVEKKLGVRSLYSNLWLNVRDKIFNNSMENDEYEQ